MIVLFSLYEFGFERMRKWWLQIPFIYWLLGYPRRLKYFTKLVDDFAKDVVEKRRKALAESTPNEETMCIVDRFILSGELSEEEIKLETFTAFTSVRCLRVFWRVFGPELISIFCYLKIS